MPRGKKRNRKRNRKEIANFQAPFSKKTVVVYVEEKPKQKEEEPGRFQCTYNNHFYSSNDLYKYHKHMLTTPHVMNGGFTCRACGDNNDVTEKLIENKLKWIMCKTCGSRVYIDFPALYPTYSKSSGYKFSTHC
jgi:DNA-directed RNA polymerase subunit RPC12/RpoP